MNTFLEEKYLNLEIAKRLIFNIIIAGVILNLAFEMSESSFSYAIVVWFFLLIKKIFFRDVIVRGSHKIPKNGPLIFVAAPHCNQFVDPIILISTSQRPVSFLMASVSLKRKIIGFFGRMLNSIPVSRAQDYAKKCSGKVYICDYDNTNLTLKGEGTTFSVDVAEVMKEFRNQAGILISYEKEQFCAQIDHIVSDSELRLTKRFDSKLEFALKKMKFIFSVAPIVDQGDLYSSVFEKLSNNECIGIFPEGGSHDRAEMLPLKAGVAVMALGFSSLFPKSGLKIIPCGLNYFNAHKFRSRAVVEFGDPLDVCSELVSDFRAGGEKKREAIEKYLKSIEEALKTVTVNVPNFQILQIVQTSRRLYRPESTLNKPEMQIELNRRFVKGYLKYQEDPKIIQLRQSIIDYNNLLIAFGIKDHQVNYARIDTIKSIFRLIFHLSVLIVFGVISLPGFIINLPALYLISAISKIKAKAAKKASSVKIHGNDVISTWKLLIALVLLPIIYGFYSIIVICLMDCFQSNSMYWLFFEFKIIFYLIAIISFATVRLSEMALNSYHSIKPLVFAIINPEGCLILRKVRSTLREQINYVVELIGPSVVDDFERNRIVQSPKNSTSVFSEKFNTSCSSESLDYFLSSYSSNDFASGRASPIFDSNMESIEMMLTRFKEMSQKKKLE